MTRFLGMCGMVLCLGVGSASAQSLTVLGVDRQGDLTVKVRGKGDPGSFVLYSIEAVVDTTYHCAHRNPDNSWVEEPLDVVATEPIFLQWMAPARFDTAEVRTAGTLFAPHAPSRSCRSGWSPVVRAIRYRRMFFYNITAGTGAVRMADYVRIGIR